LLRYRWLFLRGAKNASDVVGVCGVSSGFKFDADILVAVFAMGFLHIVKHSPWVQWLSDELREAERAERAEK
jgi:hypothetical protein